MKKIYDNLAFITVTLWVGALWVIGFMVAPTLFSSLPDKTFAGLLAARLFRLVAYTGLACGSYLVLYRLLSYGTRAFRQGFFWTAVVMLLLTLASHYGIDPLLARARFMPGGLLHSVFRDRFATWHGIASVLFVIEAVLGFWLVLGQQPAGRAK